MPGNQVVQQQANKVPIKRWTLATRLNPQTSTFASISLYFKEKLDYTIEESEFSFILASALQTVHGEIANRPQILSFKSIDSSYYTSIIRFKTIHHARVVTSLILFGEWKGAQIKFEINKLAQSPCFLSI